MMRFTAYHLPPNFHLYILFSSLHINCLFQLHTFCTHGWQSVTLNWTKNLNQRCVVYFYWHWTLSIKHVLETVSKMLCYSKTRWWAVSSVSVSSIAHHKHKTSVTFSCIHKVQLFNDRIQTAKDSHRKKLQKTYSTGNDYMKHSPWES